MKTAKNYFFLMIILVAIFSCESNPTTENYSAQRNLIRPKIDGVIDSIWLSAFSAPILKTKGNHAIKDSADLSASFKVLWDETNIYLLVDVKDNFKYNTNNFKYKSVDMPNPWECDAIELFIDSENTKLDFFDSTKKHFKYEFVYSTDIVMSNDNSRTDGIIFAFSDTEHGYLCEICIPFKTLDIKPYVNQTLGFEITVNDNDNDPEEGRFILRRKVLSWAEEGVVANAWRNTSVYGNLQLVK